MGEHMEENIEETEKNIEDLEKLIYEEGILKYDSACVRKKSNMSKTSNEYKFDNAEFSPKNLLKDMKSHSPKLNALLKNIEELDKKDKKTYGKTFKHFIFSDLKSNSSGAKLLASALIAKGFHLGYRALTKSGEVPSEVDSKTNYAISLLSDDELKKSKNNFYLLTSTGVYRQPITVANKKAMLKKFNQRPENNNGELVRFIVMDSGFKEGIDLFDIKYIHIFEPSTVPSDQKQVIGRGTRTCGQKGLEFHPTQGWPLHVFVYDLQSPEPLQPVFLDSKTALELYLKSMNIDIRIANFAKEVEEVSIEGSVDYELNRNIHSFSIKKGKEDEEEALQADSEFIYMNPYDFIGGAHKKYKKLVIRDDLPTLVLNTLEKHSSDSLDKPNKSHEEMKKYIREHYGQYSWDAVKMENLCYQKGGDSQIIRYTPTQDFVRHYFTPQNP